ncbi:hypothetical protein AOQ84DRAFT_381970 [Glonium stellatum]|uniref:C2H2-type domain-containing protein n=1 Tax=Glonium stellatum TaxID=574774 RepID=A0A8E2ERM9_9PEZI|nr:hypothetical protein AOQ84DRAFT_381970 [Glonium stellatum]
MTLRRDLNALVLLTLEDLQSFKLRKNISNLRERLKKAKVVNPNSLGQSTLEESAAAVVSRVNHVRLCRGGEALNKVVRFIRRYSYSPNKAKEAKPYCEERWLDLLFGYLTNQPAVANMGGEDEEQQEATVLDLTGEDKAPQEQTSHTCFLCKWPFSSRDALTGHCKAMHINKETFNHNFPCPEYRRSGKPDYWITSASS